MVRSKEIRYEGLSWNKPRSTLDILTAYIQRGVRFTDAPEYKGLVNDQERQEQERTAGKVKRAWEQPKNPNERISAIAANRWSEYRKGASAGVSGTVFISEARRNSSDIVSGQKNEGRLSFSLNPEMAPMFFDYMMTQLSRGALADVPVSLKISEFDPKGERTGEDAHLYFDARDEAKVYDFIVSKYPDLLMSDYLALGGRLPMLPVQDEKGNALKGIEFGQGIAKRDALPIAKRNAMLDRSRDGVYATSGVISVIMAEIQTELAPDKFDRLKRIYQQRGKLGLVQDREFGDTYIEVKKYFTDLGRDPEYPIVDQDARKVFPHFTKAITTVSR